MPPRLALKATIYRLLELLVLGLFALSLARMAQAADSVSAIKLETGNAGLSLAAATSPDGKLGAVARFGGAVSIIDLATLKEIDNVRVGEYAIVWIGFADASTLVVLEQWSEGDLVKERVYKVKIERSEVRLLHERTGVSKATMLDGRLVMASGHDIEVWDLAADNAQKLPPATNELAGLAGVDNVGLFIVDSKGGVYLRTQNAKLVSRGQLNTLPPYSALAVSRDGSKVAVARGRLPYIGLADGAEVLDLKTGRHLAVPVKGVIGALTFSVRGTELLAGTGSGILAGTSAAVRLDEILAFGSNSVSEWSLSGPTLLHEVKVGAGQPWAIATFGPESARVLAATWGGGAFVADLAANRLTQLFSVPSLARALRFSGEKELYVVADDGSHSIWDLETAALKERHAAPQKVDNVSLVEAWTGTETSGTLEWMRSQECVLRVQVATPTSPLALKCLEKDLFAAPPPDSRNLWVLQGVKAISNVSGSSLVFALTYILGLQGPAASYLFQLEPQAGAVQRLITPVNGVIHHLRISDDDKLILAAWGPYRKITLQDDKTPAVQTISAIDLASGGTQWEVSYPFPVELIDLHFQNNFILTVANQVGLFGHIPARPQEGWARYTARSRLTGMKLAPKTSMMAALSQSGEVSLVKPGDGYSVHQLQGHTEAVNAAAFNEDESMLATASDDGSVRLWSTTSYREIARLTGWPGTDWLIMSGDAAFAGTDSALERTYLRHQGQTYRLDQIYDTFYRPDIVAGAFHQKRLTSSLLKSFDRALSQPPPRVSKPVAVVSSSGDTADLSFDLADQGGGIGFSRVYVNGKLAWMNTANAPQDAGIRAKPVNRAPPGAHVEDGLDLPIPPLVADVATNRVEDEPHTNAATTRSVRARIRILPGVNKIAVVSRNREGTVATRPVLTTVEGTGEPRTARLFLISVGVGKFGLASLALHYAAKDATDLSVALTNSTARSAKTMRILPRVLRNPPKGKIIEAIKEVAATAGPEDILIFFISTHGLPSGDGIALLASDYDGVTAGKGVLGMEEALRLLTAVPAQRQFLIIDACYSGQVALSFQNYYDSRLKSLARAAGVHILSASSPLTSAREGFRGQTNGYLTHGVVKALNGVPFKSVSSLSATAITILKKQALGMQGVQIPQYWSFGDDIELAPASSTPPTSPRLPAIQTLR